MQRSSLCKIRSDISVKVSSSLTPVISCHKQSDPDIASDNADIGVIVGVK